MIESYTNEIFGVQICLFRVAKHSYWLSYNISERLEASYALVYQCSIKRLDCHMTSRHIMNRAKVVQVEQVSQRRMKALKVKMVSRAFLTFHVGYI